MFKKHESFYRFVFIVVYIVIGIFLAGLLSSLKKKERPLSDSVKHQEQLTSYNQQLQKNRRYAYIKKHQCSLKVIDRIETDVPSCCFLKKLSMKKEKYFCEMLIEKPCDFSVITILWPQELYHYKILKIDHKNSDSVVSLELELR